MGISTSSDLAVEGSWEVRSKEAKESIAIEFVVEGGFAGSMRKARELEKKDEGGWCSSSHAGSNLYIHRACCALGSDNKKTRKEVQDESR